MATKRGKVATCYYCVKNVQIRSFFWSVFFFIRTEYREIRTRKKLRIRTLFTQCIRNFNPLSHTTLWRLGYVRSCDKLKTSYLHYQNLAWWLHTIRSFLPLSHMTLSSLGLVILTFLIRFVGLPRKRLSRHRLLVYFKTCNHLRDITEQKGHGTEI